MGRLQKRGSIVLMRVFSQYCCKIRRDISANAIRYFKSDRSCGDTQASYCHGSTDIYQIGLRHNLAFNLLIYVEICLRHIIHKWIDYDILNVLWFHTFKLLNDQYQTIDTWCSCNICNKQGNWCHISLEWSFEKMHFGS